MENTPDEILLPSNYGKYAREILTFFQEARENGAVGGGIFGSATIDPHKARDIDLVLITPNAPREGKTYRQGSLHVTELPPGVMSDKIATFGHQAVKSADWIWGENPQVK